MEAKIDRKNEADIRTTLKREYIQATVEERHCNKCHKSEKITHKMQVVSRAQNNETRITADIHGLGTYQFHYDLPIRIRTYKTHNTICVECVMADWSARLPKEYANAK